MANIIKRAENTPISIETSKVERISEYEDFEAWEEDADLWYAKDWRALLDLRKQRAFESPNDHDEQWRMCEAYILNKKYQTALTHLAILHQEEPEDPNVNHSILDALYALGKTEHDFKWIQKPQIQRLDRNLLDECYAMLKGKRKPRAIPEISIDFANGYRLFKDEDLCEALVKDDRFVVINDGDGYIFNTEVRVKIKKDPKNIQTKTFKRNAIIESDSTEGKVERLASEDDEEQYF